MKNNKKIDITSEVLAKIESGQVKMRSKWRFLAEKIGLESGLLLAVVVFLLVLSLFLAYWQNQATQELLGFGMVGWRQVLRSAPYELVAFGLVLLLFINFLIKKFRWGYKRSWLVWIGVVVVGGTLIAGLVNHFNFLTAVNKSFSPGQNRGMWGNYYYKRINYWQDKVRQGEVIGSSKYEWVIKVGENVYKIPKQNLNIRPHHWSPQVGDKVKILFLNDGTPWGMRPWWHHN